MNKLDPQYTSLLEDILSNGKKKSDRTGTGTLSVFGRTIRHDMREGFPLITTKEVAWKSIVTELLWFLNGRTDLKYLLDHKCYIWVGDAYRAYKKHQEKIDDEPVSKLEFIEKIKNDKYFEAAFGHFGPIYGAQWRSWLGYSHGINDGIDIGKDECDINLKSIGLDQFSILIKTLKTDPDSRRMIINSWNVDDLEDMLLPPCHYSFQLYTEELTRSDKDQYVFNMIESNRGSYKEFSFEDVILMNDEEFNRIFPEIPNRYVSLLWNQRSADTFLGVPFNIASYGLLLSIIGRLVNMIPKDLIGCLGDTHLYLDHLLQAREQIGREITDEEMHNVLEEYGLDALNETAKTQFIEKNLPKRTRAPFNLPKLIINDEFWNPENILQDDIDSIIKSMKAEDFQLENYKCHSKIEAPLSN